MVSSKIAGSHAYGRFQNNALISVRKLTLLALIVCSLQSTVSADLVFSTDAPQEVQTQYQNFRRPKFYAAQQQEDALKVEALIEQETPIIDKISKFVFGVPTGIYDDPIPEWNYAKNGTDWDFKNCNQTGQAQAPQNITNHDQYIDPKSSKPAIKYYDWSLTSFFSFLPAYRSVNVAKEEVKDYAVTVTLSKPTVGFNTLYAAEPHAITLAKAIQFQVRWDPSYIKFHYPAEHALNNVHAQVEMQIYHEPHQDSVKQRSLCEHGVISFMFNVSDTADPKLAEPGNFFDWMKSEGNDTKVVDLSILMPKHVAQYTTIAGYVGTDSAPPCSPSYCWYINEKIYRMTTEQFEKIKVKDVPHNARQKNLSPMANYQSVVLNTGLFAEAPF